MEWLAGLFGILLNFLYNLIQNYAISIILFCIIIKILMLPLSIKQQKNMKATTKIQEKMKVLQFKYKNDPEKLNQETMALYKSEKISPFSGCFSAIIQIVLLLSVFYLVQSPLKFMRKIEQPKIEECYNILKNENKIDENSRYVEINIIREVSFLEEYINKNVEEDNQQKNIIKQEDLDQIKMNMNFLGIDLSKVPAQNSNDWKVFIIPILYVIISFISMRFLTNIQTGKKKEDEQSNPMLQANKQMSFIFPILYLTVTIFAPLGLALYWLVNSILMIIEKIIINAILKEKNDDIVEVKYISEKNEKQDENN